MLLLPTEETLATLLTGTGLKQSPIYSCQKYLQLRDEARLQGVGACSLKEKERQGRIQLLPRAAQQDKSSQAPVGHTPEGQEGTGTRCNKGKIVHPESDQTLNPAPKEAKKCPVGCSELSRTGPEPAGTTLKPVQLWSRALQVLSKPSSSAMLIFLPNLSSSHFCYRQLNKHNRRR